MLQFRASAPNPSTKFSLRSLMIVLVGMDKPRQFCLAYLFLILFWAAVALALLRLFPFTWEARIEVVLLLTTCFLTAAGAAVGGFFQKMRLWAAIGCSLGVLLLLFYWSLAILLDWFSMWLNLP